MLTVEHGHGVRRLVARGRGDTMFPTFKKYSFTFVIHNQNGWLAVCDDPLTLVSDAGFVFGFGSWRLRTHYSLR